MNISVDDFTQTIRKCRCKETSLIPEKRTPTNPSVGQCLVTALVAKDELGLDVRVEKLNNPVLSPRLRNHFYNKDKNSNDIRLCEEQLKHKFLIKRQKQKKLDDNHIELIFEWNPIINKQYNILKKNFQTEIEKILQ